MKVLDFGLQKTTGPSSGGAVACILLVSPGLDCLSLAEIVCCLSEVSILATKKGSLVFELCVTTYTKSHFSLFIGLQKVRGQILRIITCDRSKNALRRFNTGSDVSVKNSFGPSSLNKMQVFGKILGIH